MAIRAVLLGLRLRRGRRVAAVRLHVRQHGHARPQFPGRSRPGQIRTISARPCWAESCSTRPISCWWPRSPCRAWRSRFRWASGWRWCSACLINYVVGHSTRPAPIRCCFLGVALVTAAIILDAMAYRKLSGPRSTGGTKGLVLAVLCGILMSLFYFLVVWRDRQGGSARQNGTCVGGGDGAEPANRRHPSRQDDRLHGQRSLRVRHPAEQFRVQHCDHGEAVRGRARAVGRLFQGGGARPSLGHRGRNDLGGRA